MKFRAVPTKSFQSTKNAQTIPKITDDGKNNCILIRSEAN